MLTSAGSHLDGFAQVGIQFGVVKPLAEAASLSMPLCIDAGLSQTLLHQDYIYKAKPPASSQYCSVHASSRYMGSSLGAETCTAQKK